MNILGDNRIDLKNIQIGDVCLSGGQSNMELKVNGADNAAKEIAMPADVNIHYFKVLMRCYQHQKMIVKGNWTPGTTHNVRSVSAVAYFYAREVYKKTLVPIAD